MGKKNTTGGSGRNDGRTVHFTDYDSRNDVRRSYDEDKVTGERSNDHIVDQSTGEKQDIPSTK